MRKISVPLTLVALLWLATPASLAAGATKVPEKPAVAEPSAEQQADERFNQGLEERDRAWRLEEQLASADASAKPAIEEKIRDAYRRAASEFSAAVDLNPEHHRALGSLGYARRQLGDYGKALEAYDAALELSPDYVEAIEYRGEAYLGLNRIVDAQNAYRVLQEKNSELAAELLGAMQEWIAQRRDAPAGVESTQLDSFERWVADRGQAASGSSLHKRRTW